MLPSLVNLAEIKVFLTVPEESTEFDAQLIGLARNATKLLETYCRRAFSAQTYTEFFNTRSTRAVAYDLTGNYSNDLGLLEQANAQRFALKGFPVDTGEDFTVYYDTAHTFAASTALASTEFLLTDTGNALYVLKATAQAVKSLKVVYTAGYETEAADDGGDIDYDVISGAPDDLKMACITQVIFMFNKYREGNIGIKGRDKHSPEYVSNDLMLCPEAQALAAPYRRLLVGKR